MHWQAASARTHPEGRAQDDSVGGDPPLHAASIATAAIANGTERVCICPSYPATIQVSSQRFISELFREREEPRGKICVAKRWPRISCYIDVLSMDFVAGSFCEPQCADGVTRIDLRRTSPWCSAGMH